MPSGKSQVHYLTYPVALFAVAVVVSKDGVWMAVVHNDAEGPADSERDPTA